MSTTIDNIEESGTNNFGDLFHEKETIIPEELTEYPVLNLAYGKPLAPPPAPEDDTEQEEEEITPEKPPARTTDRLYTGEWYCKPKLLDDIESKRIMPVGDSITGGYLNMGYRPYLFWLLKQNGIPFEFVGSQGEFPLQHDSFHGHAAGQVRSKTTAHFRSLFPDILLVHVGHGSHAATKPISNIIQNIEFMVKDFLRAKPEGIVFLSQVIPSMNLRVYGYIDELNKQIEEYAINTEHVVFVPQIDFSVENHLQHDGIHPNEEGCELMARNFFEQLLPLFTDPSFTTKPPEPEPLFDEDEAVETQSNFTSRSKHEDSLFDERATVVSESNYTKETSEEKPLFQENSVKVSERNFTTETLDVDDVEEMILSDVSEESAEEDKIKFNQEE